MNLTNFIGVLICCTIVFLIVAWWRKQYRQKTLGINTSTLINICITLVIVFIGCKLVGFVLFFKSMTTLTTNAFSNGTYDVNTYIIVEPCRLYEDSDPPNYIGKESATALKPSDTIYAIATYQKGDILSGITYKKIKLNNAFFWLEENKALRLFDYSYKYQPLQFSTSDSFQDKRWWMCAKNYFSIYLNYHGSDISKAIQNDTLLTANWETSHQGGYLTVSRHPRNDQFVYTITGTPEYRKSSERCIIKGVEDRFKNKPNNANACAYFIQHGHFIYDSVLKNKKIK